jgi:hypothetical protein
MFLNFSSLKKILPCHTVGQEPEPTEPLKNFHPEPHKKDAAPQHWLLPNLQNEI